MEDLARTFLQEPQPALPMEDPYNNRTYMINTFRTSNDALKDQVHPDKELSDSANSFMMRRIFILIESLLKKSVINTSK